MKSFAIFYLVVILISCSVRKDEQGAIKILEISSSGEAFSLETKSIYKLENSFRIVFKDDYKLYVCPHLKIHTAAVRDVNGRVVDDKVVRIDTSYQVYATQNGKEQGLKYKLETFQSEKGTAFSVDSLLSDLLIGHDDLKYFDYELGLPIKVQKNGKIMIEKFAIKKVSITDLDTIYRFYDKDLRDIDFSFSKKLDQQSKSKLYKTLFVSNLLPKGTLMPDTEIPRREIFYEIKRVKDKNLKRFEEILDKFKREAKTLNPY